MGIGESLSWWDREFDSSGLPLRADVRSAARDLWENACHQARAFLGDISEAPDLMENSVLQVSHYLDRRAVPLFEQDTSGLLMCVFYRGLRRHLYKRRRIELIPDVSQIAAPGVNSLCVTKQDCRLDAEKALRQLSDRARQMYDLRNEGYDWEEIARLFKISPTAARAEFSRELKRAREMLANKGSMPQSRSSRSSRSIRDNS